MIDRARRLDKAIHGAPSLVDKRRLIRGIRFRLLSDR